MPIITSACKIREYNKAFKTLSNAAILPYIPDAEQKYIKPYLGKTLFAAIDAYVAGDATGDEEYDTLLPYIERALSRFTLFLASPFLDINLGETGFTTANTSSNVPASKERVKKYDTGLEKLAWENIETMLKFLEENQDDYPLWVASDAYTYATGNFIHTAQEFDNYAPFPVNRLIFYHLKAQMNNIEKFHIETIISEALADEIRGEIIDEDISVANQKIIDYIKSAVVYLTLVDMSKIDKSESINEHIFNFKSLDTEELKSRGNYYIMEIQKILDDAPDDYPLYKASDLYNEDKTSNDLYEISENDKVLGFGAITK